MGFLDEVLKFDAAAHLDADYGAESVTFKPTTGAPRVIKAQVRRQKRRKMVMGNQLEVPTVTVTVANDAVTGIASSATDWLGGFLSVAVEHGRAARNLLITLDSLVRHDGAMLSFSFEQ